MNIVSVVGLEETQLIITSLIIFGIVQIFAFAVGAKLKDGDRVIAPSPKHYSSYSGLNRLNLHFFMVQP